MATLSVLKFDDPNGADRVLIALQGMQERQLITLEDAAVVSWPEGQQEANHPPATQHRRRRRDERRVLGLPVRPDLLRAVPGCRHRCRDGRAQRLPGRRRHPRRLHQGGTRQGHGGTSALFALTSGATAVDKVVDELKQYDFEIISTNLPEEQEKQLREAFAQE